MEDALRIVLWVAALGALPPLRVLENGRQLTSSSREWRRTFRCMNDGVRASPPNSRDPL